jgi:ATP-binding cassette subfamily C (CFTR/MRP) protein 1
MFAILSKDALSPAIAGLCITYSLQISMTLSMLVRQTADVETNIVSVERIDEYTKLPEEAVWRKGNAVSFYQVTQFSYFLIIFK